MIERLEANNYRCFKRLDIRLPKVCIVAGANGSGKSTLLDILPLMGDLLQSRNVGSAFLERQHDQPPRATHLEQLLYRGRGDSFILAMEARLPEQVQAKVLEQQGEALRRNKARWPTHVRYEVRFSITSGHALTVQNEYLFLFPMSARYEEQRLPLQGENGNQKDWIFVIRRDAGRDQSEETVFRAERRGATERTVTLLGNLLALPRLQFDSADDYPASRWLLELLLSEVVRYAPDWNQLRQPSLPGLPPTLLPDASNLPWLIRGLKNSDPIRFGRWVAHVRTAIAHLEDVEVIEHEGDHRAYLKLTYAGGYAVTSPGLSDGTLRILALTLPAYLKDQPQVLIIEEPENGIHPQAIETILQSLTSLWESQVWISSHSTVVLAPQKLSDIVCTTMTEAGEVTVVPGNEHPFLKDWKDVIEVGHLFAMGVLG